MHSVESPQWRNRRVLVTGAAGFVGSWLTAGLTNQGAHVCGFLRPVELTSFHAGSLKQAGVTLVPGLVDDIECLKSALQEAQIDTVFHLAAVNFNVGSSVSPLEIFQTNTAGTWNVLEACRLTPHIKHVVVASSTEATDARAVGKDGAVVGRRLHPYQVSKMSSELVAQAYADTYGLPVSVARSDNIYGGGDFNWHRLIPGTIRSLARGEQPVLRSDGKIVRHYLYVEDVVRAYLSLAEPSAGSTANTFCFAASSGASVLEIVTELAERMGRPDLKPLVTNESTGERLTASTPNQGLAVPGWKPQCNLGEGLDKTVAWYRHYFASAADPNRA